MQHIRDDYGGRRIITVHPVSLIAASEVVHGGGSRKVLLAPEVPRREGPDNR